MTAALAQVAPVADIRACATLTETRLAVNSAPPDLAFVDLLLENGASGLTVMRDVHAVSPLAQVVLMTGLPREHPDVELGFSRGAFAYLRKPVHVSDVRRVVDEARKERDDLTRARGFMARLTAREASASDGGRAHPQ